MTQVTAFSLSNLPLISRQQAQLSQLLSACLPGPYWEDTFADILQRTLHKYLPGQKRVMLNFRISNTTDTSRFIEKSFIAGEQDKLILGRNPICELHLADRVVSSQHARIAANKQGFYIIDQSVNGTLLNGKRLPNKAPTSLNHGDIIGIHPFQILFTISQSLSTENLKIDFTTKKTGEITTNQLSQKLATDSPLTILKIEPIDQLAILQMDADFVTQLVQLIIGHQIPENNNLLRHPLSKVEAALIEFLLLRIIKEARAVMTNFANWTIQVIEFYPQGNPTQSNIFHNNGLTLQTTFQLTIGETFGYIHLYVPQELLQTLSVYRPPTDITTLAWNWLSRYGQIKTCLIVTAGELQLTAADLLHLEPMDIVLLSNTYLNFQDGQLFGEVTAWLGQGGALCFRAELLNEEQLKILLQQVYHHPQKATPKGELVVSEKAGDTADSSEGIEYAQSVPLTIAVELGRCNLTLAETTRLRLGQILNLRRAPQEPVDLTIEGKLIGKGELVNIEGEIGVRILQLHQ
jgi:flagellar motor switch/type III secretory pathway protein FliN/pSer/pThr/pTyr-binding forkhead associated (FHA) protein